MRSQALGTQDPATVISPISSDGVLTEPPKGTQRASAPTARTARSIETRSLAIVNSRSGSASSPSRIARPEAPTEKTPETGLTPECRPATSVTRTPSPASRSSSSKPSVAGRDDQVGGRDRGLGAIAAAAGVAGRGGAAAVRRVGVVEVGAQRAALDQGGAAARHALGVEGRRGQALGVEAVVVEDEGLAGDLLAEPLGERRAAALHRARRRGRGRSGRRSWRRRSGRGRPGRSATSGLPAPIIAVARSAPSRPIAAGSSAAGPRPRSKPSPVSRPSSPSASACT